MGVGWVRGVGMERSQLKLPGRGGGGANQELCIRVVFSSGETVYELSSGYPLVIKHPTTGNLHYFMPPKTDSCTKEVPIALTCPHSVPEVIPIMIFPSTPFLLTLLHTHS